MKLTEAIDKISEMYIPGCVDWWANRPVDLWLENMDQFNERLSCPDVDEFQIQKAADEYVLKAKELIKFYGNNCTQRKFDPVVDGFLLGEPDRVDYHLSITHNVCVYCGNRESLTIKNNPGSEKEVHLVCRSCLSQ